MLLPLLFCGGVWDPCCFDLLFCVSGLAEPWVEIPYRLLHGLLSPHGSVYHQRRMRKAGEAPRD